MKRSIFKPIVFGALFGAAAFFVPFLLIRMIFFFMIIGLFFRLFWWRGKGHRMRYHFAYADKIRSMSEEEYAAFKSRMGRHHYGHCAAQKQKSESGS